jgi:thioredoxin-related protein
MYLSSRINKFYFLSGFLICLLLSYKTAAVTTIKVKQINNLQVETQLAKEKNLPLLVLFSLSHCPFCKLIKEDFLIPMIISGDYKDKIMIREMNIEENPDIIDFSGITKSSYVFAKEMEISLFPTMVFVDYQGCKLAQSIKGINTPSLFGGRIDDAIDEANKKIKTIISVCN